MKHDEEMTTQTYNSISGSFGALASAFVIESLQHMIIWIMVMAAVVFADLVTGIAKCLKIKTKIRFSKAVRDTMGKFCTYFAVVVCTCMTQVASQSELEIEKGVCLLIIFIEAVSILGNILKMKGYSLDFGKAVALIISKKFELEKDDVNEVITKDEDK